MGEHKFIHGYSAKYPFFPAKQNHVVFNPPRPKNLTIFLYPLKIIYGLIAAADLLPIHACSLQLASNLQAPYTAKLKLLWERCDSEASVGNKQASNLYSIFFVTLNTHC
jgi:hypothetical protein